MLQMSLNNKMGEISVYLRYALRKTDAEVTAALAENTEYQELKKKHDDLRSLMNDCDSESAKLCDTIKEVPYDIVHEDIAFRGSDWKVSYRGFTGLPCPSCKIVGTFRDGKCTRDGTDQYVSEIEKDCASNNFVTLPKPSGISPELIASGKYGFMGTANLLCPKCRGMSSFHTKNCCNPMCRAPQYPEGTTDADVIKARNHERSTKCFRGILDLPCPFCERNESFIYEMCYGCRLPQYATDADVKKGLDDVRRRKCYMEILDSPCPSCGQNESFTDGRCVCGFGQHDRASMKMKLRRFFLKWKCTTH